MTRAPSQACAPFPRAAGARRGLTLVEVVLAVGLFSLLMLAVFRLLDGSLGLWRRAEARRDLLEQSTVIAELFAADLRALEGGSAGDLLVEWVRHDVDGDGADDAAVQRVRLVRQVTAARRERLLLEQAVRATGAPPPPPDPDAPYTPGTPALSEVCWALRPEKAPAHAPDDIAGARAARDARAVFTVWRGERLLDDPTTKSFFAPDFFRGANWPAGALEEVSGGVLRCEVLCAAPTSILRDGWQLGDGLRHVAPSWDAWTRGRPDRQLHPYNSPHPGTPPADAAAIFPRRVRLELDCARPVDRERQTRLRLAVQASETAFEVAEPERIPRGAGAFLKLDAEWVEVTAVAGSTVLVRRGRRGTTPAPHAAGALLHHGANMSREIPLAVYREDWALR